MKKAKVMLMVIAILAVVGGALAFKASKFNPIVYCTSTTTVAGLSTCSVQELLSTFVADANSHIGYRTTLAGNPCPSNLQCTSKGDAIPDAQ